MTRPSRHSHDLPERALQRFGSAAWALRHAPGFFVAASLTLALGIGFATVDDAADFALQSRALSQAAYFAWFGSAPVPIRESDRVARLRRALVSGNFFDVLGARATRMASAATTRSARRRPEVHSTAGRRAPLTVSPPPPPPSPPG